MKRILCFGDSNTYGYRPDTGERYPEDIRWTGILKNRLRERGIEIIEEGLVGRTTVFEDSLRMGRRGIDYLVPLLESHAPIDKLVLMLGTNDCKNTLCVTAEDIANLEAAIEENQAAQLSCGADFVRLQQLQAELTDLEAQLEHKTERWMYLTELAEKIEAQKK